MAPPALEDEVLERPWPLPMKMKLAPYAMYRVFSGAGRAGDVLGCAYFGLHFLLYTVRAISLSPLAAGRRALFWGAAHGALQALCYTATALIICVFICQYMSVDGVYVVKFDPPPPQLPARAAATVVQVERLPPPPPEMDMC